MVYLGLLRGCDDSGNCWNWTGTMGGQRETDCSDGLLPQSDGLQPNNDGLQRSSNGLQPSNYQVCLTLGRFFYAYMFVSSLPGKHRETL